MAEERQESVSSKRILEELQSERFQSGLRRVIGIANDLGREAAFTVDKEIRGNRWFYPENIRIGNEKEVPINSNDLFGAFCAERKDTLKLGFLERYELFKNWLKEKGYDEEFTEEYPFPFQDTKSGVYSYGSIEDIIVESDDLEDSTDLDEANPILKASVYSYSVLDVHTHPSGTASPSLLDLQAYRNERDYRFESGEIGVKLNPIHLIVGVFSKNFYGSPGAICRTSAKGKKELEMVYFQQKRNVFDVFIYQQIEESDLGDKDLEEAVETFYDAHRFRNSVLDKRYISNHKNEAVVNSYYRPDLAQEILRAERASEIMIERLRARSVGERRFEVGIKRSLFGRFRGYYIKVD